MINLEGKLQAQNTKIALVVGRFNDFITSRLEAGAIDCFVRHNGDKENLTIVRVPGAFEIPLTCQKLAKTNRFDGILAVGAIIRGATPHFDYVANEASKGVASVSLKYDLPISFGILTTENIEQAIERAGTKAGNKGSDTMLSLLETIDLFKSIS